MSGPLPTPPAADLPEDAPARSVRAQLLATEHWSLLASRSTAQSEVLTRIQMHLTLVSATLLTLALIGQATAFEDPFPPLALVLLILVLVIGMLTQIRVVNVAHEDLMYVLAMNRLRGAYARLSPGIEHDFVTSTADDRVGASRTYAAIDRSSGASQVLGSSMVFSIAVNAILAGLLGGLIVVLTGNASVAGIIVGAVVAVAYALISVLLGSRGYFATWKRWTPRYGTDARAPAPPA